MDSKPRPSGPKPDALPSCAIHRYKFIFWNKRERTLCSAIPNIMMHYQTSLFIDVNLFSRLSPRKETEVTK